MRRLAACALLWLAIFGLGTAGAKAGVIEGTVSPIEWAPEVEVCLVGSPESCVAPMAGGAYRLVASGGSYLIEFVPSYRSRLLTQYYDHKALLSEADPVRVFGGAVTGSIDADLLEGGAITGTATSASDGTPLHEVDVCAVSATSTETCTTTDTAGRYELHSLPTGGYRVGFWGEGASAEYEPWYYGGGPSFHQGMPVEVEAGKTTGEIDASLTKGAQIRGVVTAAAGSAGLEDVAVCLFAVGGPSPERCTTSDDSGEYAFQGLVGGSYQVGFSLEPGDADGRTVGGQDGFASQFYDGVGDRAHAASIYLVPGQIASGVDASLAPIPPPPPLIPPPPVSSPVVAAVPALTEPPQGRARACRRPRHRLRINGKIRCVKRHRGRKRHRRRAGKGVRGKTGGSSHGQGADAAYLKIGTSCGRDLTCSGTSSLLEILLNAVDGNSA